MSKKSLIEKENKMSQNVIKKIYFFTRKQAKLSISYEKKIFYVNSLQKTSFYSLSKLMRKKIF